MLEVRKRGTSYLGVLDWKEHETARIFPEKRFRARINHMSRRGQLRKANRRRNGKAVMSGLKRRTPLAGCGASTKRLLTVDMSILLAVVADARALTLCSGMATALAMIIGEGVPGTRAKLPLCPLPATIPNCQIGQHSRNWLWTQPARFFVGTSLIFLVSRVVGRCNDTALIAVQDPSQRSVSPFELFALESGFQHFI